MHENMTLGLVAHGAVVSDKPQKSKKCDANFWEKYFAQFFWTSVHAIVLPVVAQQEDNTLVKATSSAIADGGYVATFQQTAPATSA